VAEFTVMAGEFPSASALLHALLGTGGAGVEGRVAANTRPGIEVEDHHATVLAHARPTEDGRRYLAVEATLRNTSSSPIGPVPVWAVLFRREWLSLRERPVGVLPASVDSIVAGETASVSIGYEAPDEVTRYELYVGDAPPRALERRVVD
jgi:hypothetical protein